MATQWINPTGGNDANNGTTKALAVKTFAHLLTHLSNNDTVYITDGTHDISSQAGTITFTQTGLTINSESGKPTLCILDAVNTTILFSMGVNMSWSNITFKRVVCAAYYGILACPSTSVHNLTNLIFTSCYLAATYKGLIGVYASQYVTLNITGCIFNGCYSDAGRNYTTGIIAPHTTTGSVFYMTNCTLYNTGSSINILGGYYSTSYSLTIKNMIIQNAGSMGLLDRAAMQGTGTLNISYSCLYSSGGTIDTTNFTVGSGMLYVDPLMVDPANEIFELQSTSPCIDVGGV